MKVTHNTTVVGICKVTSDQFFDILEDVYEAHMMHELGDHMHDDYCPTYANDCVCGTIDYMVPVDHQDVHTKRYTVIGAGMAHPVLLHAVLSGAATLGYYCNNSYGDPLSDEIVDYYGEVYDHAVEAESENDCPF